VTEERNSLRDVPRVRSALILAGCAGLVLASGAGSSAAPAPAPPGTYRIACLSVWSRRGGGRVDAVVNTQIRAICCGTYVDLTRFRDRPQICSSDGFHPNDVGYGLIARAVESELRTG
jgi:hypothetical protein